MFDGAESDDLFETELRSAKRTLSSDLYHYTSAESAILGILATKTLRLSPFLHTNDLWESRPFAPNLKGEISPNLKNEIKESGFLGDAYRAIWEEVDAYIRGHSKVACFTNDWELPDYVLNRDSLRGWAHLSLWAHYGDSHRGVCLRFDRERLLAAFESARGSAVNQFADHVRYRYSEIGPGPHGIDLAEAEEFGLDAVAMEYARTHFERIYFHKHGDWASESEFRLVRTDRSAEPFYLDISSALTGVVLGVDFPEYQVYALIRMLEDFENVQLYETFFFNRALHMGIRAHDKVVASEDRAAPLPSIIQPNRAGDLFERVRLLDEKRAQ